MSDDIEQVVEEARKGFDLKARLQKRAMREATITVYTDEVTGAELGDARTIERKNSLGIITDFRVIREGVLGRLAELEGKDDDDSNAEREALEARKAELIAKLDETALTIHLRAVPDIVIEAAERSARKALGIKGKITEDKAVEFNRELLAHYLAECVVSIKDHADGATSGKIDVDAARALKGYLPRSEFARLDAKLGEVQFKQAVSESVTAQADFSPSI